MTPLPRLLISIAATACILLASSIFAQQNQTMPSASDGKNGPIVKAPAGAVEGKMEGDLRVFKGIPYALPPVGSRRWRPPSAMPPWPGIRKAIDFGPICFQPVSPTPTIYSWAPAPMSEDCLTLNIWAPTGARKAPVFFWIHGGALTTGSSRDTLYDGTKLAVILTDLTQYAVFSGTYDVDIPAAVGGSTAYAGFTAATGALFDTIKILNWSMTSY